MAWFIVMHIFATLLDWMRIGRLSAREKDLEILALRQQLAILERNQIGPLRVSRIEKLTLTVITMERKPASRCTVSSAASRSRRSSGGTMSWFAASGHSSASAWWSTTPQSELARLIVQLARENDWGYGKIAGELLKLGYTVSKPTIANVLARQGVPRAPERIPSPSWRHLMTHYKMQLLIPGVIADTAGTVRCRNVLGGIIHDYYREAA
ncbi:MAG: hypothetical protein M5R40_06935 [Anaerolineae bacterium]|nr:hypothetical protein [Anaerolineae bacterium]